MKSCLSVLALAFLVCSPVANASGSASTSSSFGVSATVESGCLAATSPGSFPASTSLAESDSVSVIARPAVSVSCTNPTAYSVRVESPAARVLTLAGDNAANSGSGLQRYLLMSGLPMKRHRAETSSPVPDAFAEGIIDAEEQMELSTKGRAYPDAITVTITY